MCICVHMYIYIYSIYIYSSPPSRCGGEHSGTCLGCGQMRSTLTGSSQKSSGCFPDRGKIYALAFWGDEVKKPERVREPISTDPI